MHIVMASESHPPRLKWRRALRLIEHFFAAAGLVLILYHLGFEIIYISSSSMYPTLSGPEHGKPDWVLIEKWTYRCRAPRRWEVAALYYFDGTLVAKRVAGLPGEKVTVQNGYVTIDGKPQPPPEKVKFLRYTAEGNVAHRRSVTCGATEYFFLGDDTRDSLDSRFVGAIGRERITGRPLLRVWPPARWGWVNP